MKKLFKKKNEDLLADLNFLRTLDNNIILSGSLALVLHGTIKERECNDLDIIIPYFIDFSTIVDRVDYNDFSYIDKTMTLLTKAGNTVDVIIEPQRRYTIIDGIKVSNVSEIIVAKLKAFALFGNDKHTEDILSYLKKADPNFKSNVDKL